MGQKHSAKYSLKKSGGNNKQQTAKIEDEIAFNTDSPGQASDDPIGVNLSSSQNDYIRNAANNMAKVWTETAVIESNGRKENGNDRKEKKSLTNGEEVAANMPEVDKSSVPDNHINQMQGKPADEESMPNNEGDVIQNIVMPEISQEEQQKVTPIAEKPTIRQTEYAEEENIVPDEQILSNTTAEECDENIQQIVDKNDTQPNEIEAKMDLYEENGPNEVKEIGKNELEKVKTEVFEMPNEINKNSMEMPDEQNEVTQHKEEEVANHSMLENAENQNPILEGIADYVANQQNVQSANGNEPEEVKSVETESDGKDNFVSKNEDEKHHAEIGTEDFETSNNSSMLMVNVDAIMDDPKISTGSDNELKKVNQNGHQNECQKLANDIDNGEPNSTAKPSQL